MAVEKSKKRDWESKTVEVVLKKEHTHGGVKFQPGATLNVTRDTKKFLSERNII